MSYTFSTHYSYFSRVKLFFLAAPGDLQPCDAPGCLFTNAKSDPNQCEAFEQNNWKHFFFFATNWRALPPSLSARLLPSLSLQTSDWGILVVDRPTILRVSMSRQQQQQQQQLKNKRFPFGTHTRNLHTTYTHPPTAKWRQTLENETPLGWNFPCVFRRFLSPFYTFIIP